MHAWVYLVIDLNRYNMGRRDDICMLSSVGSYGYPQAMTSAIMEMWF
jgi:hypothetical protein